MRAKCVVGEAAMEAGALALPGRRQGRRRALLPAVTCTSAMRSVSYWHPVTVSEMKRRKAEVEEALLRDVVVVKLGTSAAFFASTNTGTSRPPSYSALHRLHLRASMHRNSTS